MTGQTAGDRERHLCRQPDHAESGEIYEVRWRVVRRGSAYKVREAEIIGFR